MDVNQSPATHSRWHVIPATPHMPAYIVTDLANPHGSEIAVLYGTGSDEHAKQIVDAVNASARSETVAPGGFQETFIKSFARQEALEEAAKVCDSVNNHDNPMTAGDCADAIRALKPAVTSATRVNNIVSSATLAPRSSAHDPRDAFISAFKEWFERDGSVGALSNLVEGHAKVLS